MNLLQRARHNPALNTGPQNFAQRAGLVNLFETWNQGSLTERIEEDFVSFVRDGMQSNAVIWSLCLVRMTFFAQIEFVFEDIKDRTWHADDPSLTLLRNPWMNGSTQELLARMEQDASMAGNSYIYKAEPSTVQRLRPDWVEIVGDPNGTELVGYKYTTGGPKSGGPAKFLLPDEVTHYSPVPDPLAVYRGCSWITPVVREVMADKQMTRHKQKFFDNAATPNLLIKNTKNLDDESRERLRNRLEARHEGVDNAYRTLVLEGGADATIIGANMQEMAFDTIQAAGENRIAAAAGVPGIVAGFKEGLQAATYSNYAQAKRHFVDGFCTFHWGSVSKALETIVPPPEGERLWYDPTRIPALKEDRKDLSEIVKAQAFAMMQMVRVGFDAKDVEIYVTTGERPPGGIKHTGMIFFQGAEAVPGSGLVAEAPGQTATGETPGAPADDGTADDGSGAKDDPENAIPKSNFSKP